MQMRGFETHEHQVDFCVLGGGMAGLIAAVSAARRGAKVLLMQDRPVLGGNASSEVRMWICGARGADAKETGLLEEILLANYYRNRGRVYSLWDTVLYEKARFQDGLTLLLNCACHEVTTEDGHITALKGWQTTTQTFHAVHARYFADCSGDSVLRICGAEFRQGRESRREFGESHAPEEADPKRMPCWYPKTGPSVEMPPMLPRAFAVDGQDPAGRWQRLHQVENNCLRLVRLPVQAEVQAVRFVPLAAWGAGQAHVMAFEAA